MLPTQVHPCPHCGSAHELRGLRLWVPIRCTACGTEWRARRQIDRFELLEPLARGAFSMIFLALDPARGETVALKILQPPYGTEEEDVAAFLAVTQRLMEIEHPHIARIFAVGVEHGLVFVAREWLAQGSLAARITRRGRLPQDEVVELGWQAASALAAAQEAGLFHRDLEPGNVVFAAPRIIKLTDFGQAVFFDRAADLVGTVWGQFCYVAPERLRHMPEDARSDMYALGATLMHALVGQPPYEGEHHGEILFERLELEPLVLVPKANLVHPTVAVVLNALLAPDQNRRPPSWAEVVAGFARARAALEKAAESRSGIIPAPPPAATAIPGPQAPRPRARRPAGFWSALASAAVLVLAGVAAAWHFWPRERPAPAAMARPAVAPQPAKAPATSPWRLVLLDPRVPGSSVSGIARWREAPLTLWLTGSSDGPAGRNDAVAFAARAFPGDWTLSAQVSEVQDGFGGLLVRESEAVNCWMLAIAVDTTGKAFARVRQQEGTPAQIGKAVQGRPGAWLRLERRGPMLFASYSGDGRRWEELGRIKPSRTPAAPLAGFIAYAPRKDGRATATFERINAPGEAADFPLPAAVSTGHKAGP